jgi:hypothetical protein
LDNNFSNNYNFWHYINKNLLLKINALSNK